MSETVQTLILSSHILVGILLVSIILIQRGKGSDAGMAFGGGSSDTVFGASGSGSFLTKTTKWLAVAFFSTSLALAYVHNQTVAPTSILDTVEDVQQQGENLPLAAPLPADAVDADNSLPQLDISTGEASELPVTIDEVVEAVNEEALTETAELVEEPKSE